MPHVTIESRVSSPQSVIAPRLFGTLVGYASRDDFALRLDLGVAGAAMTVPVRVTLDGARTTTSIPITLEARQRAGWFPTFRGEARSESESSLSSYVRLSGFYEVPLGALGPILDRTVLKGAAERSLRSFLERLRADVLEEVRRSELDYRRKQAAFA